MILILACIAVSKLCGTVYWVYRVRREDFHTGPLICGADARPRSFVR